MWYTPLAFQKYEINQKENLDKAERSKLKDQEIVREQRVLLQYTATIRCLPIEMAKRKIHNRYRRFADLNN